MNEKNSSKAGSRKSLKKPKKQSDNSGLLKHQEVVINKKNLIDIVSSWLYATRMIDEARHIRDIKFIEGDDKVHLQIYTNGGETK